MQMRAHRFTITEWVGLCSAVFFFAVGAWWMTVAQATSAAHGSIPRDLVPEEPNLLRHQMDGLLIMLLSSGLAVLSLYRPKSVNDAPLHLVHRPGRAMGIRIFGVFLATCLISGGIFWTKTQYSTPELGQFVEYDARTPDSALQVSEPVESANRLHTVVQGMVLSGLGATLAAWVIARKKQTC